MPADLRFDAVVSHVRKQTDDDFRVVGFQALCSTCGEYRDAERDEFETPEIPDEEHLEYVAKMRAWNCCHADEDPRDGYPEQPDYFGATRIGDRG